MIFSDLPVDMASDDKLERNAAAQALARAIRHPAIQTPLTVGVFGGWGSGKTSVMRLIKHSLSSSPNAEPSSNNLTLWFDAWLYSRQEQSLWRALLLRIVQDLGKEVYNISDGDRDHNLIRDKLDILKNSLYRNQVLEQREGIRVSWNSALPLLVDLALRFATSGLSDIATESNERDGPFTRFVRTLTGDDAKEAAQLIEHKTQELYVEQVQSLEQFRSTLEVALNLLGVGSSANAKGRDCPAQRRLFVFIDDLDRCLPEDAITAIEALKLFLDLPGCVFVLGMDREIVEAGVRARYLKGLPDEQCPFQPSEYLDKIIQIPYYLPPISGKLLSGFLDSLSERDSSQVVSDVQDLVKLVVTGNPRAVKRVLNALRVTVELDGCGYNLAGISIQEDVRNELASRRRLLAKIVLMQICFPAAYRYSMESGDNGLTRLEFIARGKIEQENIEDNIVDSRLSRLLNSPPYFEDVENTAVCDMLELSDRLQIRSRETSDHSGS